MNTQVKIVGNEIGGFRAVLASNNAIVMAFAATRSGLMMICSQQNLEIVR